jgi:transcriptional regulator with XRE-family HTH domain
MNNLKQLRTQRGLRQDYVASSIGISKSYLCKIENNVLSVTEEILTKLVKMYGVNLRDVYS